MFMSQANSWGLSMPWYFICVLYEKGMILSEKYFTLDIGIAWKVFPLIDR